MLIQCRKRTYRTKQLATTNPDEFFPDKSRWYPYYLRSFRSTDDLYKLPNIMRCSLARESATSTSLSGLGKPFIFSGSIKITTGRSNPLKALIVQQVIVLDFGLEPLSMFQLN